MARLKERSFLELVMFATLSRRLTRWPKIEVYEQSLCRRTCNEEPRIVVKTEDAACKCGTPRRKLRQRRSPH